MSIRTVDWMRIEGAEISNLYKEYGTLSNIPVSQQHVYYGHPEIQLNNPYSTTHSVVYAVKSIKNYFGYNQIHDIDLSWSDFQKNISTWIQNNPVNTDDADTSYYYVNNPFTVNESCVIFYDDSSKASVTGSKYSHYAIVLIDKQAVPKVISITAEYTGNPVPVQEKIDVENNVKVTAVYDDGNSLPIKTGFTLEPKDKVVKALGANLFTVYYTDNEDDVNTATFLVQGVKNLQYITGTWDGGSVAYKKEAKKQFFVIVAHYTDGTSQTVTHFTFPNGNIVSERNNGLIDIYYQGKECQVQVHTFKVQSSRLIAYYNGPNVEVQHDYDPKNVKVKIYYQGNTSVDKSYYEDVDIADCQLSSTKVTQEGTNSFIVSYTGELGPISTTFTVAGIIPDVKPTAIEVNYTGSDVYQGYTVDREKIICRVYYNDGKIKQTKDFNINEPTINNIGDNQLIITYTEKSVTLTDTIVVKGLERESTSQNNIFPVELDLFYPQGTFLNNRYRGPAESAKTERYSKDILDNFRNLYEIYAQLEKQYNSYTTNVSDGNGIKMQSLNTVRFVEQQCNTLMNDKRYSTGKYQSEVLDEDAE